MCERAYHALFMNNMLIRPTREQLSTFGEPDYVIYNAGLYLMLLFYIHFLPFIFSGITLIQEASLPTDTLRV